MEDAESQVALTGRGFWVLAATVAVGLAAAGSVAIWLPYQIQGAYLVAAFVAVAVLGLWAASGRVSLVALLFAGAGALLAPPVFSLVLNLIFRATYVSDSRLAPGTLEIVGNWTWYALYAPVLLALVAGTIVAALRHEGAPPLRAGVRVALCVLGALYAAGVLYLWLRVGFGPYLRTEFARSQVATVYTWATEFPIQGLGAASGVALWSGVLQPRLARRTSLRVPGVGTSA